VKKVKEVEVKYITLNTALIIALVALIAGFILGNVYSLYKSGSLGRQSHSPQGSKQAISMDQSGRMLALEREVENNPSNMAAWLELGNLYFDTGKFGEAIQAYSRYLSTNPNDADVWTDLGVMYRRSGNPNEAITSFDRAIEIDPRHEQSRFNKGVVQFYDLGNRDAAVRTWQELVGINPNFRTTSGQTIKEFIEKF
jgi:cytochrome c-type biogenesis protein CcmH/NrfG